MRRPSLLMSVAAVGVAALATSACLSSGSSGGGSGSATGEVKGSTVTIWTSVDQPVLDGLEAAMKPKADALGMTVKWSKVDNINQLIMTKIQANDTPDIALIPQPGVVADIVNRGKATALDDVVDKSALQSSMIPGTLESGTVNGKLYGLLVSANTKSFVFYPKKAWDKAGYQAPQTIDELNALTEKIKADGTATAPWCMGIGSEAATGWPATDWFEDLIMRYGGTDGYNSWVKHDTKFNSPLVKQAAAEFEKLLFTQGNVLGGRKSISSNAFGTAGNPMFNKGKPGCMMYKQGSFITGKGFFPDDVVKNLDSEVGVFYFPPAQAGGDKPVLGGGDMAVLLHNTAGAQEAMKLLSDKSIGDDAAGKSSFLSPHKDFDVTKYGGTLNQEMAKISYGASVFLFDGSDQMPGAVGAGTFWKDMTAWISNKESLDKALNNIDNSWPSS
ncbi:ABC transporter substrate-binding protein [Spongisporangium articulatum]|uniref:ABC transporter substrate-binding protein n=1 Tax=Spongisporangium articulatum TaxID=3362603 RepID=A0ABW8AK71_9ACTN